MPLGRMRRPHQPELYEVEPPGLLADDLLTPTLMGRADQAHVSGNATHLMNFLSDTGRPTDSDEWALRSLDAARLRNAIVDSGASFTYVTAAERLDNPRDSTSAVWVANGMRERVAQEGDIGPLRNVKQVRSFKRSLVSVADLVDQFGGLFFDQRGVHVVSKKAGNLVSTTIGLRTPNRLFSFNIGALSKHVEACTRGGSRTGASGSEVLAEIGASTDAT